MLQVSAGLNNWDMSLAGLGYGGAVQPLGNAQTTVNRLTHQPGPPLVPRRVGAV